MDRVTNSAEDAILNYLSKVDTVTDVEKMLEKLQVKRSNLDNLLYPNGMGFISVGKMGGKDSYWLNNAGRAYLFIDDSLLKKIVNEMNMDEAKEDIEVWSDFDEDSYPCIHFYFPNGSPVSIEETQDIIYDAIVAVTDDFYLGTMSNELPITSTFTAHFPPMKA